jgi:hypothetical protein
VVYSSVSGSFSVNLNIFNDNLKASNGLSYDVTSLFNLSKLSLIAVRKEVVSFGTKGNRNYFHVSVNIYLLFLAVRSLLLT